jgi:hypothetical protein
MYRSSVQKIVRLLRLVGGGHQHKLDVPSSQMLFSSTILSHKRFLMMQSPLFNSVSMKYSCDSVTNATMSEKNDGRYSSIMSPKHTNKDTASLEEGYNQEIKYDEDYDRFESHMSGESMTSQDDEQLDSLEMLQHEDVVYSSHRITTVGRIKDAEAITESEVKFPYESDDDHGVEFEEWEILHVEVDDARTTESTGICEIYDNIDDVNDVIQ